MLSTSWTRDSGDDNLADSPDATVFKFCREEKRTDGREVLSAGDGVGRVVCQPVRLEIAGDHGTKARKGICRCVEGVGDGLEVEGELFLAGIRLDLAG